MKALSPASVSVLKAIAAGQRHGFDIMDLTGLPSGTVYPILGRLEKNGVVRARWESTAAAHREKRPPRRYYEITGAGSKVLARSIEYYRALTRALPAGGIPRPSHG
jgi:PadR family transcriptional regulator PadR